MDRYQVIDQLVLHRLIDQEERASEWVNNFASAIAQAHEQELADYKATIEELERDDVIQGFAQREELHQARLVAAQAQVVGLAEALSEWTDVYERMYGIGEWAGKPLTAGTLHLHVAWQKAKQALSAAPKMLYHGKAQVTPRNDFMLLDDGIEALQELKYPYQVDAILLELECLPKAKQGQNSEHSYQQAKGAIPWHEGDELPEDMIARLRGRAAGETWSEYRHRRFPNMYAEGHRRIGVNGEDLDAEPRQPSDSAEERQQEG